MSNSKVYDFNKTSLENLMKGIQPFGDISAPETLDGLKKTFKEVLNEAVKAKSNYLEYAGYNDYLSASSIDIELNNRKKILTVDGGEGKDTLLIDHYIVKSISDIKIDKKAFKDRAGSMVDGYVITITDIPGNVRTYNVTNVEKLRFVDSQNNMQEIPLKYRSQADRPSTFVGLGEIANFGAEDNTIKIDDMGKGDNIEQIDGGDGKDIIDFHNLDEANIDSITYDQKSKYYTMTINDGNAIKFRNFETLKLKHNTYKIQRPSNNSSEKHMLTLEERFVKGAVSFSDLDSALLSKGVQFGSLDDRIVVRSLAALTGDKTNPASFYGGSGEDILDLSFLPKVKLTDYEYDKNSGAYTLKLNIGTAKREILVKTIEKIKLSSTITVDINEKSLKAFLNGPEPTLSTKNIITSKSSDWKMYNYEFIGSGQIEGSKGKIDILSLEGNVEDYIFTYVPGHAGNDIPDTIKISRFSDSSILYIDNIDAVKFSNGQKYRLLDNKNKPFGDFDLTKSQFGSEYSNYINFSNQIDRSLFGYNATNIYYGTESNDSLSAGSGDDTFFMSDGNDSIDGGFGSNTFILENIYTEYYMIKTPNGYAIQDRLGNITNLTNIQYIIYCEKGSDVRKIDISKFYEKIKNQEWPTK